MKLDLRSLSAEELFFKIDGDKLIPNEKINLIPPQFSCEVRRFKANEKLRKYTLSVKIESNDEEPKALSLSVKLAGIFETEIADEKQEREFAAEATKVVYPNLRAAVTSLTASAYVMPINLPIVAPVFDDSKWVERKSEGTPSDPTKPVYAFTVDDKKLN